MPTIVPRITLFHTAIGREAPSTNGEITIHIPSSTFSSDDPPLPVELPRASRNIAPPVAILFHIISFMPENPSTNGEITTQTPRITFTPMDPKVLRLCNVSFIFTSPLVNFRLPTLRF